MDDDPLMVLAKEAFSKYDINESGTIDQKELTAVLRSMGQNPTDSQVHDMINEVDVDGSGLIEFHEFVKFIVKMNMEGDRENEARECFRRFDCDGQGKIAAEDFRFVMKHLPVTVTDEEVEAMLREADKNGDGQLDLEEFKIMMGI